MAQGAVRSHRAGELGLDHVGREVRLAGWVGRRRDHGGVLFIDLRDASGLIQVVIDPEEFPDAHALRMEYCISVSGLVRPRPDGTENPELDTGQIEVDVDELIILSPSEALPFTLDERTDVDEQTRLTYRYLDLRRSQMAHNLKARSDGNRAIRDVLGDLGFMEVETPTLIKSTPEGARDLLVPARLRPGHFYALPQSPQLYKQLLMVGGIERYFQIARCYRDEDFRSDRQVEFTQLDLEGSFWSASDVQQTIEVVVGEVVRRLRGVEIDVPLPRITYAEAMANYGTDKPDMRFGMHLTELSELFRDTDFKAFDRVLAGGGAVRGFNAGAAEFSRAQLDRLVERAQSLGAKGLVWMVVEEGGSLRSPIAKFLSSHELTALTSALDGTPGDLLLLMADDADSVGRVLGILRVEIGQPDGHDDLAFVWVDDFPVFEVTDDGGLVPSHHPFTAPADVTAMRENPADAIAQAYDLVLNGSELGSGSVRIHDPATQAEVFEILGISEEEARSRFGWFLEALKYGTPPHAGFAMGLDRLFALLQQQGSIREVIAFPKTQSGGDPLTSSPGVVDDRQLRDLGLDLLPATRAALEEEDHA